MACQCQCEGSVVNDDAVIAFHASTSFSFSIYWYNGDDDFNLGDDRYTRLGQDQTSGIEDQIRFQNLRLFWKGLYVLCNFSGIARTKTPLCAHASHQKIRFSQFQHERHKQETE
jgi:hypothetical protein